MLPDEAVLRHHVSKQMKPRFTLFRLLAAVALASLVFAVIYSRERRRAIEYENALLRFDAAVSKHEKLHRLLSTESFYDFPSKVGPIAAAFDDEQKPGAIAWVEEANAELEIRLKRFDRITNDEYLEAIAKIQKYEFAHERVIDEDARKIVAFIEAYRHIDPRILKMEPWVEGSIKITTGVLSDGWGFLYIARKDGGGNWVVRYQKGVPFE